MKLDGATKYNPGKAGEGEAIQNVKNESTLMYTLALTEGNVLTTRLNFEQLRMNFLSAFEMVCISWELEIQPDNYLKGLVQVVQIQNTFKEIRTKSNTAETGSKYGTSYSENLPKLREKDGKRIELEQFELLIYIE